MRLISFIAGCAVLLGATQVHAVGLTGDFGTTILATDRAVATNEPVTRIPVYHTLRFEAGGVGHENLSWVGSFRMWYDMKSDADDGGDFRTLRSYLRWNDRGSRLEGRLGRQFVSEGVGRSYMDGLFVRKGHGDFTSAVFLGQPLRQTLYGGENWPGRDAYQWGAHVQWRGAPKMRLGMSYSEMRYDGDTGERLIGASAVYRATQRQTVTLITDLDAEAARPHRLRATWTFNQSRGRLFSVDAHYRNARLWSFNRLTNITPGHYAALTASALTPFYYETRLYIGASALNAGGGFGGTGDLGLHWRAVRFGYLFASTAATTGSGLYVRGTYRVNDKLLLGARTNWTRYEHDRADESSQAIGSALFATYTPVPRLDITVQAHQITNDMYSYQLEGLLSLRWRFSYIPSKTD